MGSVKVASASFPLSSLSGKGTPQANGSMLYNTQVRAMMSGQGAGVKLGSGWTSATISSLVPTSNVAFTYTTTKNDVVVTWNPAAPASLTGLRNPCYFVELAASDSGVPLLSQTIPTSTLSTPPTPTTTFGWVDVAQAVTTSSGYKIRVSVAANDVLPSAWAELALTVLPVPTNATATVIGIIFILITIIIPISNTISNI